MVVTEAEQLEETPETRVTLEPTETPERGVRATAETQVTLVPQEPGSAGSGATSGAGVRLRLLGLARQVPLVWQEEQAGRLLMQTKL